MNNKFYDISNINNKKIALFSDLHYSNKYDNEIFLKIFNNLKINKPDYICIAGDIIDDSKTLEKETLKKRLYKFIESLSKICKVIIIPGNHDFNFSNKKENIYKYNNYFEQLNKIDNVYYLSNENIVIDNINFIGLNLNHEYYYKYNEKNINMLLDNIKKIKNQIVKNKYNILLFHSPINITNKQILEELKEIDLILCGHMHNGLAFKILDKIKTNYGFVSPYRKIFPKLCRGKKNITIKNKKITLIISGGIIKLSEHTNLNKFNKLFGIHIEYIKI